MKDLRSEIMDLLEEERIALLGGRLDTVGNLEERKARLVERLGHDLGADTQTERQAILDLAARNQQLLRSAAAGLREAIRRIAELKLLQEGRGTYSQGGTRDAIASAPTRHDRRA